MKMKYSRKKEEESENSNIESNEEEEEEESSIVSGEGSGSDSEAGLYEQEEEVFEKNESELDNYNPNESDKKLFVSNLNNIRVNVDEVTQKMKSVLSNFSQSDKAEIKYGISYLDSKNYFMLVYLTNLLTYSLFKCTGKEASKINNHAIIKQMIYIKTILEKTKVIDLKLKTQIDRLLKLGEKSLDETKHDKSADEIDENNFRPMILDNDEEEEQENLEEEKQKVKYKVQRDFHEFFETTEENKSRKKQIEKVKDKVRNSEMYKEIREQFNDAPKEVNPFDSEYSKFMKEVEDYEENNFTRVKVPKRELKKLRKMDRKNNDLTDFGREFKNLENILHQEEKEEHQNQVKFLNKKRAFGDAMKNQQKRSFDNKKNFKNKKFNK